MPDLDVNLALDLNIRIPTLQVCEEVEREDDGAIRGIFKGHDAVLRGATLYRGEDVLDADLWDGLVSRRRWEAVYGSL